MSAGTDTPQPLPYFVASTKFVTQFKLRQGCTMSEAATEGVKAKILESFPDATVSYSPTQLSVELVDSPIDQMRETYDKLYSAMFMRVNYGLDGAVLESILQVHPELRGAKDLGQLLTVFNTLLRVVKDLTPPTQPVPDTATLSKEQLDTLQVNRFGDPAKAAEEHKDGGMRGITAEQAAAATPAAQSAAARLRSQKPIVPGD